ncbi:MAG: CarD family transcriptional regulator [Oscillospiraceae bacterium]|jgi:CarD family transcriptional regulator|nr:CarD family transcriptional regulator [Oscillospiraceae bacterium]
MFSIGDTVIYGSYGICKITGVQDMTLGAEPHAYYVLAPVYEDNATFYLPVGNEKAEGKLRRILSTDEIYKLIKEMPNEGTIWVPNDNERREQYRRILSGSSRSALVQLIKTLYQHGEDLKGAGKSGRLTASDDRFLKDAEKALYDEFAHVLGIPRDEVLPLVTQLIEENEGALGLG